jgi:hypothetical protein
MKKLGVGFLAVVLALSLGSCSTIETDFETPQEPLLKKAQLKRDASGAYSIDYIVADKTESSVHKNLNSLTNEIHLSKVGYDTKDQYRNDFTLENNKLRVGFFDAETGRKTKLTIEDENITLAKGNTTKFLKTYELATNNDGTIQLDFEVNENVITEFVYNEDLGIHEVHLSKGVATNKMFSRSLTVPDTGVLKLDFVNHKLKGKGTAEYAERKPVIVFEDDSIAMN